MGIAKPLVVVCIASGIVDLYPNNVQDNLPSIGGGMYAGEGIVNLRNNIIRDNEYPLFPLRLPIMQLME